MSQLETQAAQYVAGYVASRFCTKYPYLTVPNHDESSWTDFVSKESISVPPPNLMKCVKSLELDFIKLHGDKTSSEAKIMFIRLNDLNSSLLHSKTKCTKNKKLKKFTS